ncbi:hypothetical protein M2101_000608 [Parabacteroides sp. PM5-20]|nr:hypothetical protein [Parabacteroides sp. PM5-20]
MHQQDIFYPYFDQNILAIKSFKIINILYFCSIITKLIKILENGSKRSKW